LLSSTCKLVIPTLIPDQKRSLMANREVNLTKKVQNPHGWRYCRVLLSAKPTGKARDRSRERQGRTARRGCLLPGVERGRSFGNSEFQFRDPLPGQAEPECRAPYATEHPETSAFTQPALQPDSVTIDTSGAERDRRSRLGPYRLR